uniref:MHD domain-containing protein n=1 Tax=Heterorhabditis bacteriophora TaxID=37862 RepID=A0A1I7XM77_HETBA
MPQKGNLGKMGKRYLDIDVGQRSLCPSGVKVNGTLPDATLTILADFHRQLIKLYIPAEAYAL